MRCLSSRLGGHHTRFGFYSLLNACVALSGRLNDCGCPLNPADGCCPCCVSACLFFPEPDTCDACIFSAVRGSLISSACGEVGSPLAPRVTASSVILSWLQSSIWSCWRKSSTLPSRSPFRLRWNCQWQTNNLTWKWHNSQSRGPTCNHTSLIVKIAIHTRPPPLGYIAAYFASATGKACLGCSLSCLMGMSGRACYRLQRCY